MISRFSRSHSALATVSVALPAAAQTPAVDAARRAGQSGERFDGYLGLAGQPFARLAQPGQRDQHPPALALQQSRQEPRSRRPQEVGITAGCQLLARVQVGEVYMLADGSGGGGGRTSRAAPRLLPLSAASAPRHG